MTHHILNLPRLLCPMPVIKMQDQVALMQTGDTIEAICSDSGALQDIPAWARINGHQIIKTQSNQDTGEYTVILKIGKQ